MPVNVSNITSVTNSSKIWLGYLSKVAKDQAERRTIEEESFMLVNDLCLSKCKAGVRSGCNRVGTSVFCFPTRCRNGF